MYVLAPRCGGTVLDPGRRGSPPPDDGRHGGADDPGEEVVGQRPQPVEELEAVEAELDGSVLARERAAPLPAALRYGKGLESRPIFTRALCHSHAERGRHAGGGGVPRSSSAERREVPAADGGATVAWLKSHAVAPAEALVQHSGKGAAILGRTHNAPLGRGGAPSNVTAVALLHLTLFGQ